MSYDEALAYLDHVQGRGMKLGLENVTRLLAGMGDPQRAFPAVVVGGTNGKGSVCAFLASILTTAGHRTGLYTSPHLVRYEERIAVDGLPVSAAQFARAIGAVRDAIDRMLPAGELSSHPTHFEILTAAAFHHFREAGVEVGVVEVGMGGRLDAAATARTSVAVITNVTLEHTKHLGGTVEAIAREKAGIIREGCHLVTGETDPGALAVIREAARGRGVRVTERFVDARVDHAASAASGRFRLATRRADYGEVVLSLAGRHQVENATLAVLAAEALCEAGLGDDPIPPPITAEGLARAHWPGRMQIVGEKPLIMLDGAHNPAGCESLARALRDLRDDRLYETMYLVFGALQDKELEPMLRPLLPLASRVAVTRGRAARFLEASDTAAAVRALGAEAIETAGAAEAIAAARSWARPQDAVVVCGSLYLVGDALEALGVEPFPSR